MRVRRGAQGVHNKTFAAPLQICETNLFPWPNAMITLLVFAGGLLAGFLLNFLLLRTYFAPPFRYQILPRGKS
jgi:hypothetical protein